ncbi:O-antigen ligase family protein [Clostridium gasigenes]|uniref:O-antigen ligase family protein n=1 Tax=Clostridium gasigenes TaxID=94869 RepID=UPI001C0DEE58|nr:O-antigen ligase family protein [Clostridium gasigenes]MBU3108889.1 O-antigen ligase family protein [Clostridium gasigenes]
MKKRKGEQKFAFDFGLLLLFIIIPNLSYKLFTNEVICIVSFILVGILGVYTFIKYGSQIKLSEGLIIVALIVCILISSINSSDIWLSLSNSLVIISMILVYITLKTRNYNENNIVKYILLGGGLYSLLSIIVYIITYTPGYTRLDGLILMNYANGTALFLAICSVVFFSRYELINKNKYSYIYKIVNLIILTCFFATQSRGGFVVYLIALLINIKVNLEYKLVYNILAVILSIFIINNLIAIGILFIPIAIYIILVYEVKEVKSTNIYVKYSKIVSMIIIFIGVVYFNASRVINIGFNINEFQERLVFMEDGINLIKHNILGIGAGNFNKQQFLYQSANYDIKYIHNSFIQYGIDFGIVFSIIYIGIVLLTVYNAFKKKKLRDLWFIIFIMILIHSMIDFSLSFLNISVLLSLSIYKLNCIELKNRDFENKNLNNKKSKNEDSENEDLNYKKNQKWVLVLITAIMIIGSILFLPYQIAYNLKLSGSINESENVYKKLNNIEKLPFKDNRFYFKKGIISLSNNELVEAEKALNRCVESEKNNIKGYEALSNLYIMSNDIDLAEKAILNTLDIAKYSVDNYAKLAEIYSQKLQAELKTNNLDGIKKEIYNIDNLDKRLDLALEKINKRSNYMKNQPVENINEEYQSLFNEAKELKKLIVGN